MEASSSSASDHSAFESFVQQLFAIGDEDETSKVAPVVLTLPSSRGVHTPGIVNWAKVGYRSEYAKGEPVGMYIAILAETYGLGHVLAERVLRDLVRQRVEGETLILTLEGDDASAWRRREAETKSGR